MFQFDRYAMPSKASSLRKAAFGVALASACLVAHADARAADVLTFPDALRIAAERSQKLVARDAAASAARDMAVAAGQLPDPMLKLGLNNLPINGPDAWSVTNDFMTMRSIGLSQEFTREAKRKARADRFEREADAAEASRTLALATLQRDTALAWLDRYYQERLRETLIDQRDETRLQVEAADAGVSRRARIAGRCLRGAHERCADRRSHRAGRPPDRDCHQPACALGGHGSAAAAGGAAADDRRFA